MVPCGAGVVQSGSIKIQVVPGGLSRRFRAVPGGSGRFRAVPAK